MSRSGENSKGKKLVDDSNKTRRMRTRFSGDRTPSPPGEGESPGKKSKSSEGAYSSCKPEDHSSNSSKKAIVVEDNGELDPSALPNNSLTSSMIEKADEEKNNDDSNKLPDELLVSQTGSSEPEKHTAFAQNDGGKTNDGIDTESQIPSRKYQVTSTRFESYRMPSEGIGFSRPAPNQMQNTSSYPFGAGGFPTPFGVPPPNRSNHYQQQMNIPPSVLGGYTFAAGGYPVPFGVQTPNVNGQYYQHQMNPTTHGGYPFAAGSFSAPFGGPMSNANGQYYQDQMANASAPRFGAGNSSIIFPYQQSFMPEFLQYGGTIPHQPMPMGYSTRDSLASMLALQQSMILTQYQSTLMSSRPAEKASESNTEENLAKEPEQNSTDSKDTIMGKHKNGSTSNEEPRDKKPTVNMKKINKDVNHMLKKILHKNGVIPKFPEQKGRGGGGYNGRGGRGGGYKRGGRGGGRGRGGNGGQGLSV